MSFEAAQERRKQTGRNDACPCGSGAKYKKCHQAEDDNVIAAELRRRAEVAAAAAAEAAQAEEEEGDGKTKAGAAGRARPAGHRPDSAAKPSASRGAAGKAQNLPRRGAV